MQSEAVSPNESAAGADLRAKLLGRGLRPDSLPPAIPVPIPENYLFTGDFTEAGVPGLGQYMPFKLGADQIELDIQLVALGVLPGGSGALYCLDLSSGQVVLVDVAQRSVTGVNSTFKAFCAFLNAFNHVIAANPDPRALAANVPGIREWMLRTDAPAFDQALSDQLWWPVVLDGLIAH